MTRTEDITPTELAEAIKALPHVEDARYDKARLRVVVTYPRDRGGRLAMTIPAAKAHLAKEMSGK